MAVKNESKLRISKYMPYFYAGASLDFNLIHIDREFAQANGLPDIILQGMCTMALTAKHIIKNDNPVFNNDNHRTNTIYLSVTNYGAQAPNTKIQVTLTLLKIGE